MKVSSEIWDWQSQDCVDADNPNIVSKCMFTGLNQSGNHLPCSLDNTTTPVNTCGDLAYNINDSELMGKELEECQQPSSQAKRRRMLQFEPEDFGPPLINDDVLLRSKESQDSLEDAMPGISECVTGYAEGPSPFGDELLDPSTEGWIADCFNDAETHLSIEDIGCASEESDVQIDIAELCNTPPECDANALDKLPVHPGQNVVFKGRRSYMRTPPKLPSSVVYPFTFIKPCGIHGDVTLKDINRLIHTPPKSKENEQDDPSLSYQTSAFSGKPVVGKTKIRTEGGEGSITIVRTKG